MPYQQFSWATIRGRLQDRYEGVPFWTDPEALLAFNEGLATFNLLTGRWKLRTTLPTVAAQALYTLPDTILYPIRAAFNGRPLSPSSLGDLDNSRYTWRDETTLSGGTVPNRPTVWAPFSFRSFYLWPADAIGGGTLTIDAVATTPVLVEDGDTLDLGEETLTVLLGYALHVLSFTKGGPFFEATQPLFTEVLAFCAEENDQIKTSQAYRRWMGLQQRDLRPLRGTSTDLDALAQRTT